MKTRAMLMLLAILGVGVAAMPAYSVCGTYNAIGYYINQVGNPCVIGGVWNCGGNEYHWHILWPYYAGHTYSQEKANGSLMTGSRWFSGGNAGYSPNKATAFGSQCLASAWCDRCLAGNGCGASGLTVRICL